MLEKETKAGTESGVSSKSSSSPPFKNPMTPTEPTKVILLPSVLVVTSSLASYFVGRFNYSVLYALGAGLLVSFSIMTLRDKITQAAKLWADRQAERKACVREDESAEWINATVYRFWQFYEPVLSQQIKDGIDQALKDVKPPGLSGIKVQRFTLGKVPPFISSVRFLLKDKNRNDISESRIVLNLGLGIHAPDLEVVVAAQTPAASLPLSVKDIFFEGNLRIEIDLIPQFPHAQKLMVTFLEKPIFDFQIVPLKSVSITEIPGLAQFLNNLIHSALNDNVVNPEKIVIPLMEQAGGQLKPSNGVIDCSIHSIEYQEANSKNPLMGAFDKTPQELYCKIIVGDTKVSCEKTCALKKKGSPYQYNSRHLVLSESVDTDMFQIHLMTKNKVTQQSRLLGKTFLSAFEIREAKLVGSKLEFCNLDFEGDSEGKVVVSLDWLALDEVKEEEKLDAENTKQIKDTVVVSPHNFAPSPKGQSGTIYLHVHQAFDLQPISGGKINSLVRVYYTDKMVMKSREIDNSLCPHYDVFEELTCGDLSKVKLTLRVQEGHSGLGDLDLDLEGLFYLQESNSYNYQVLRKWFTLRKSGPVKGDTEAETLAKMKNGNQGGDKKNYGKIELSILFRPFDLKKNEKNLIPSFDVGNADDDLTLSCYDLHNGLVGGVMNGVGAVGSGMVHGVGTVGSGMINGVGTVGSGMVHGVGTVGSGMVHGVGAVGSEMGKLMRIGSSSQKKHSEDDNKDAEAGNPIDLSSKTSPERQRRNSFSRIFSSK